MTGTGVRSRAEITLYSTSDGGPRKVQPSGTRQMLLSFTFRLEGAEDRTVLIGGIVTIDDRGDLAPGDQARPVQIDSWADDVRILATPGEQFALQFGGTVVGHGVVLSLQD